MQRSDLQYFKFLAHAVIALSIILSAFDPIVDAFEQGKLALAISYSFLFALLLCCTFVIWVKSREYDPPKKNRFMGPDKPELIDDFWSRGALADEVTEAILGKYGLPVFLVGPSGAGKSVLLHQEVFPRLRQDNWRIASFRDYDYFNMASVEKGIRESGLLSFNLSAFIDRAEIHGMRKGEKLLLVFDQFEKFIAQMPYFHRSDAESPKRHDGGASGKSVLLLRDIVNQARETRDVRIVFTIRKEFYFDLRLLEEMVPKPIHAIAIPGFSADRDSQDMQRLVNKFHEVVGDREVAERIVASLEAEGHIAPVVAQVVGLVVENTWNPGDQDPVEYYFDHSGIGGREGAIRKYFLDYARATGENDTALKVLFALSARPVLRTACKEDFIVAITHESDSEVRKCCAFLQRHGVISTNSTGRLELAHDFLAERFHELSGELLEPSDRDNILFFWDAINNGPGDFRITKPRGGSMSIGRLIFYFISILLLGRLMAPVIRWGSWWDGTAFLPLTPSASFIDMGFLAIAFGHLSWAYYVSEFYHHFLRNLKEGFIGAIFTWAMIMICAAGNIGAVLLPHMWLLCVGIGGLSVGLKFIQLYWVARKCKAADTLLGALGAAGLGWCAVIGVGGLFLGIFADQQAEVGEANDLFVMISVMTGLFLGILGLALAHFQVSRRPARMMIGLMDRVRFMKEARYHS